MTTTPNKIKFTTGRVADFRVLPGQTQSLQWDSATPGLGQLVSKTSSAYVFQSRFDGKAFRLTIGKTAVWRLSDAQTEARRLQVQVDSGHDPRRVKADAIAATKAADTAQQLSATRDGLTLGSVWPLFLAEHKAKWSEGHYRNHVNFASAGGVKKVRGKGDTVSGPLHSLMALPLPSLTPERITEWLATESATRPTNAAQAFRILRAFANWADDVPAYSGLIPARAFTSRAVRASVPPNNTKHGDSLQREQLELWFKGVRQLNNPIRAAYLQALLLTGARRTELTELRWENVDTQWNTMLIGDKYEGMRTIPLTPYLSHLFANLPRRNGFVFYSAKSASGHMEEPKDAHAKALKAVGLPHLSIHGLRRSFGTLAEWLDVPVGVVAQINGHKPSATIEKSYRRRPIDILRYWHIKIEEWMLSEAKVTAQ